MARIENASDGGPASAQAPWDGYSLAGPSSAVSACWVWGRPFSQAARLQRPRPSTGRAPWTSCTKSSLSKCTKTCSKSRLWESKVKDLLLAGGFRGVAHLYVGQEAVAVGVSHALRKDDYIASNHRGHGHLIAKGGDLGRMLAEITHKATGYCKGYGGSLHITDVSLGILGMNGIVGASHLFAAGEPPTASRSRAPIRWP